jgi:DNA-binding response OmpR family regulator
MNILIVEDNRDLCRLYAKSLAAHQHSVSEALTCAAALGALGAMVPDAILLDMELPDGTGLDILRFMRSETRFAITHVIAVTGNEAFKGETKNSLSVDLFLLKPVSIRLLQVAFASFKPA